jgi:hypothetical protein
MPKDMYSVRGKHCRPPIAVMGSVTQKVACVWFYNVIRYKVWTTLVIPNLHENKMFQQDSKILQPFKYQTVRKMLYMKPTEEAKLLYKSYTN